LDTFLSGFTCAENDGFTNNCDPKLDAIVEQARGLQATSASAAADKWAQADRMVVGPGSVGATPQRGQRLRLRSRRNYQYDLSYGVLLDQIWVK